MIALYGMGTGQTTRESNVKVSSESSGSDVSFSESLKEIAKEHKGKIEGLAGFSLSEADLWKQKLTVENKGLKQEESIRDILVNFEKEVKKVFKRKGGERT